MCLRFWCRFFCTLLASTSASAQGDPVTLSYLAPAGCPNRQEFWRELVARSAHLAQTNPPASRLFIGAQISTANAQYVGRLRLADASGTFVEREVTGPTCVDVTAALALIVAVTIDGFVPKLRAAESTAVVPVPRKPSASIALGPIIGIHRAIAPRTVPTLGLSVAFSTPGQLGATELRLEGMLGLGSSQPVFESGNTLGNARFLWLASRAVACSFQLSAGPSTIGPCILFELGALRGKGSTAAGERSNTGWWVAPGAALDGTLRTDPFRFRLTGGVVGPLIRDTFVFAPRPEVFRPPSLGLIAELEVSWIFF